MARRLPRARAQPRAAPAHRRGACPGVRALGVHRRPGWASSAVLALGLHAAKGNPLHLHSCILLGWSPTHGEDFKKPFIEQFSLSQLLALRAVQGMLSRHGSSPGVPGTVGLEGTVVGGAGGVTPEDAEGPPHDAACRSSRWRPGVWAFVRGGGESPYAPAAGDPRGGGRHLLLPALRGLQAGAARCLRLLELAQAGPRRAHRAGSPTARTCRRRHKRP